MKNFAIRMFGLIVVAMLGYYGLYLGNSAAQNLLIFYVGALCVPMDVILGLAAFGMEAARRRPDFEKVEKVYSKHWGLWMIPSLLLLLGFVVQGWWFCVFFYSLSLFGSIVFQIAAGEAIRKNNDPEQKKIDEEKASRERFAKNVADIIMRSTKGPQ